MIISDVCSINVLLVLSLALASVINYTRSDATVWVVIYDRNLFITQYKLFFRFKLMSLFKLKCPYQYKNAKKEIQKNW
jgi:hypothetical protein